MGRPLRDENSTNVRNTVAAFVAGWAICVVAGAAVGVFTSLSSVEVEALAIFAALFASATYFLDAEIRAWIHAIDGTRIRRAAGFSEALLLAGVVAYVEDAESIAAWANAVWLLFVLPLALAIHVAVVDRARLSSPRAKAPGVRRAAI